jgi:U3 small nucleolar RNA-associated protein 14
MIKTHELLHSLKNVSETGVLKKLFAKAHKRTKVLETPLPKNITEKSQRIATYIEDKKEVSKWDPVVKKNRRVKQYFFVRCFAIMVLNYN